MAEAVTSTAIVSARDLRWRHRSLFHHDTLLARIGIQTESAQWGIIFSDGSSTIEGLDFDAARRVAELFALDTLTDSPLTVWHKQRGHVQKPPTRLQ